MIRENRIAVLDVLGNYGHYTCNVGKAMDEAGISISRMRQLTGLNHEIVKKYYEDSVIRLDKDVLARIAYILILHGVDINNLIEYIPPQKKDESAN